MSSTSGFTHFGSRFGSVDEGDEKIELHEAVSRVLEQLVAFGANAPEESVQDDGEMSAFVIVNNRITPKYANGKLIMIT
uniref:Uncharacterized protein n=1 Tax=Panagrolaimus sp. ES5 TaxID=591445 RepID=A0AC34FMW9_9BILA